MIIVKLYGGLGNQLFQYALGRNLALKHRTNLFIDTRELVKPTNPSNTIRKYQLDDFKIQAKVVKTDLLSRMKMTDKQFEWRRLYFIRHKLNSVTERHSDFDPSALGAPNYSYLDGYWQSYKYFEEIADVIRAELSLSVEMSDQCKILIDEISSCVSVSIHVRRGDYITNPNAAAFHGVISPNWYSAAVDFIQQQFSNVKFFVFSDDIEWATRNLTHDSRFRFINNDIASTSSTEMILMSRCQHHIIANSTFSWWGAWLNPSSAKRVIAPKYWFKEVHVSPSRIPEGWQIL